MKNELNKGIRFIIKQLERAEKLALDQMPDICNQMIVAEQIKIYSEIATNLLIITLCAFFGGLSLYKIQTHPVSNSLYSSEPIGWYIGVVISVILSSLAVSFLIDNIKQFIFLKKCIKLFLLREFKDLIKK